MRMLRLPAEIGALIDALNAVEGCASPAAVWTILKTFALELGISLVMVTKEAHVYPFSRDMLSFSELSEQKLSRLEPNERSGGQPPRRVVLRSPEPFLVSKTSSEIRSGKFTAWYAVLHKMVSKEALFVVPVDYDETVAGVVTFAGDADRFDTPTRSIVNVLAYAACARAQALAAPPNHRAPNQNLSKRETQCLAWIANGKTGAETARQIGISARTVRFHLDNARTKLGVVTLQQAVRKARHRSIIRK